MKLFSASTYKNRRLALQHELSNKGVGLFLGNEESPMNYKDNTYRFRQDSSFLYFFGLDMPGLIATIDFSTGEATLWGDDPSISSIIWTGPQPPLRELAEKVGISNVTPLSKLKDYLSGFSSESIMYLPPYRGDNIILLSDLLSRPVAHIKTNPSALLTEACAGIRSVKEPQEVEEMEKQMAVAYAMHTTAMVHAQAGVSEQYITGLIEGISISNGGPTSFPIILSRDGQTLHNHNHDNILKDGDLMLVDAGSESLMHYATDHTRVSAVGGKFSNAQKAIYEIVLKALDGAQQYCKPGVTFRDTHLHAAKIITQGLQSLGLMKGNLEDSIREGAHALFFPHGLGHMIGLDVHDMEDYGAVVGFDKDTPKSDQFGLSALRFGKKVEAGYALTIEPGIYFIPELINKWQAEKTNEAFLNFKEISKFLPFGGIRLEDDIIVDSKGARTLGKRIPITIDDVEKKIRSGANNVSLS